MEFSVQKSDLVKELQLVQGVVERKSSIPILANVLIEAESGGVRFAATDLDVSLRGRCSASVSADGAVTVGAKKLFEIARSLPEKDVRIKALKDAWVTLECDRANFRVAGLPKEDFPALPEAKAASSTDLPADVMRDLIARTGFAITAEDARYYLAGALLVVDKDGVAMVATDGHRLAYAHRKAAVKVAEAIRVLVPRKAIQELSRLLEGAATVGFQRLDNHLLFVVGERSLAAKSVEGQFPAFEKVISASGDKSVVVGREDLAMALRRVSLLSSERSRAIKLALSAGRLDLTASSPDMGEARESLTVDYKGETVEIGFNAQYVLDFLGAVGGESVLMELKDGESQGIFRPYGESAVDYRYVVMPMRL